MKKPGTRIDLLEVWRLPGDGFCQFLASKAKPMRMRPGCILPGTSEPELRLMTPD